MYPGEHAKTQPDKPAYVMARSGRVVTFRELDEGSNRAAHLFRARGLSAGDGIAIFMENHPLYLQLCWGAQRSGLIYTAISSRLTAPEVEYIVKDCGAKILITSAAKADVAKELTELLPDTLILVLDAAVAGCEAYDPAAEQQPITPIDDETEGDDMLYSSGTTGRPKGIKKPLAGDPIGTLPVLAKMISLLYGVTQDSVYLSPAPLYHAAPLRFNMNVLRLGATCIIMERFDPSHALELIDEYKVTHSQWVPTMFVRMLKLPEEQRAAADVSSLKIAIHAAAPCPVPVKEQMIDWWGPVLFEYYAGTEGNGFAAVNSKDWLEHKGTVGKALSGTIHILGEENEPLPTGEIGNVYFEGGGKFEYHNAPEKTAESHSPQGYSTLGDVGYLDEDGYLYLTDRKSFMIISGGVNIYPQEAENILITHPRVEDVAVIGVPNEDFGEEVKAVVQLVDMSEASEAFAEELLDFCRSQLAHFKCPRSIDFDPELPRHPTGKLYKRLLKDRYWGDTKSRIV